LWVIRSRTSWNFTLMVVPIAAVEAPIFAIWGLIRSHP
jgi:hypothetical protein